MTRMYRYYGERMHFKKNLWYITLKEKPDNILRYHLYASANTLIIMIFKYPQIENLNSFLSVEVFKLVWIFLKYHLPTKYNLFKNYLFILFFFFAVLGVCRFVQAFSSCNEQGLLSSRGVPTSCCGGLSYCGAPA